MVRTGGVGLSNCTIRRRNKRGSSPRGSRVPQCAILFFFFGKLYAASIGSPAFELYEGGNLNWFGCFVISEYKHQLIKCSRLYITFTAPYHIHCPVSQRNRARQRAPKVHRHGVRCLRALATVAKRIKH